MLISVNVDLDEWIPKSGEIFGYSHIRYRAKWAKRGCWIGQEVRGCLIRDKG